MVVTLQGETTRPKLEWWLNGDPWIEGPVSDQLLQGGMQLSAKQYSFDIFIFAPDKHDATLCGRQFPITGP